MNTSMKSKTTSTNMFHQKTCSNTITSLPMIHKATVKQPLSNDKMKDKIITLKKELNKRKFEYHELKLVLSKLSTEKEMNRKILTKAMIESQTADKPIELIRSNSQQELKISLESYAKLKEANTISSMKHHISVYQRMIKEKDEEIEDLKCDSKVVKLIERNNQLLDVLNKTTELGNNLNDLQMTVIDKEAKAKEEIGNRDYYKALNATMRIENESLKEKYAQLRSQNDCKAQKLLVSEEKVNNLKFQFNTTKQTEKEKDTEIKIHSDHIGTKEHELIDKEKYAEESRKMAKEIQSLKDEIAEKTQKMKELEIDNANYVDMTEKEEAAIKRYRVNENSQVEAIKKEISKRDKDIWAIKDNMDSIVKQMKKIQASHDKKKAQVVELNDYDFCGNGSWSILVKQMISQPQPQQQPKTQLQEQPQPQLQEQPQPQTQEQEQSA